ncbi:MAG: molybdate transport system substrate-binding protein [Gammaproteobacteria bacterium]|jgi:molybdate transport system substrate-binding protein
MVNSVLSIFKSPTMKFSVPFILKISVLWILLFLCPLELSNAVAVTQPTPANSYSLNIESQHANVAVASNFIKPMQQLKAQFEANTPHTIRVSYSSSGKLFAQIINGAPFDVFLSADQVKPDELIKRGKAKAHERFTYAQGTLILWSSKTSLVNNSPDVLYDNNFRKVALANPKFAPYGQAAVDVLNHLVLLEQTKSKWVMGESISQTYQFVATGNADIGFISFSQKPDYGSYWLIPEGFYKPIKQDAILLKNAEKNASALAFFQFLKSNEAKNIIQSYHYNVD